MDEEPTYALSEKSIYDPFERELRQARAYIDLALELYENKMPLAAIAAISAVTSHMAGADCELRNAIDESKIYATREGDDQ